MATPKGPLTPKAAFVVKTFRVDEAGRATEYKVFINVCCLDEVGRPITKSGIEATEEMLDERGIDNLQVPIHVGAVWEDTDHRAERCMVTDVVFHPCVTNRCLAGPLKQHYQKRVAELAMQFVEEDSHTGLRLSRQFKLPRMTYKGQGPPKQVVFTGDRAPLRAKVTKTLSEEDRKWVEEITKEDPSPNPVPSTAPKAAATATTLADHNSHKKAEKAPLIKKGFLNDAKTALYPKGSENGVLPPNAGDPLGYLPEGLRKTCKVVDPTQTYYKDPKVQEILQQREQEREEFKRSLEESAKDTSPEEFLSRLKEFGSMMFPETVPKEEWKKRAEEANPFAGLMGHPPGGEVPTPTASPSPPIKTLADLGLTLLQKEAPAKSAEDEVHICPTPVSPCTPVEGVNPHAGSGSPRLEEQLVPAAGTLQHSIDTTDTSILVTVQLPMVDSMSGVELTVEPRSLHLEVRGHPALDLELPEVLQEDLCKAQFSKKKRVLVVSIPRR
eukprot:GGOE01019369.1.p1 GENE.GGOE01019369.1~~GGOE01019369.1.p1  ORF type:complete len:523 (-),score=172.34 GGOE01019369.1:198-1691(-)